MLKMYTLDYVSPLGVVEIVGTSEAVHSVLFAEREMALHAVTEETPAVLALCAAQLDEYFRGERFVFDVPYAAAGTPFQQKVWQALTAVGYGRTGSYRDIAAAIGHDKAVRAVGAANGRNKLTILIPCHRIIGSNRTLTGYAGGIWRKEWLLKHEAEALSGMRTTVF